MLTIGKLGTILGLHPDTIRKYERRGLIPAAKRSPLNGYRIWAEDDVEVIRQAVFGLGKQRNESAGHRRLEAEDFDV